MDANTDFYALLGVPRDASDDEIKKAYRRAARELHPDANGGDPAFEERFKEVTLAYEVLRDPERRARYDRFGIDGVRGAGATGGTSEDFFSAFGGASLGDLFEAFFGGAGGPFGGRGRGPAGPPRGADLEAVVELEFADAVFGTQCDVPVRTAVPCTTCDATGAAPGTHAERCATCGGAGEVRRVRQSILGQVMTAGPCPRCGGAGVQITTPCADCRGEGRRVEERSWVVDVPAGVDDGTTLRLTGRGSSGPRGGPLGDLYVHLRVRPHPRFERAGTDLLHRLAIPMTQAALGVRLPFETLDGDEELVIPAGTQSGEVFVMKGRGVPRLDGRGRGDIRVEIHVETPTDLPREQEEMLREFAAARGEDVEPHGSGLFSRLKSAFK